MKYLSINFYSMNYIGEHLWLGQAGHIFNLVSFVASVVVFTGSVRKSPVDNPIDIQRIIDKLPSPYAGLIKEYNAFQTRHTP